MNRPASPRPALSERAAPSSSRPHPFLKWAGGKRQLLGELLPRVLAGLGGGYHEPFLGGGALFFELARLGRLPARVSLGDTNPALVEAYEVVRDDVQALVEALREHAARHDEAHYYAVRAAVPATKLGRAARILYLNRTCFNGLYRENSRGQFNVPMGRYTHPEVVDPPNLRACSAALQGVALSSGDFASVEERAQPGDLVYFDPPYDPVSSTASFTGYAKGGFGADEQRRLAALVRRLDTRGVHVLLSNSMTPLVCELYAGLHLDTVLAGRAVNSKADRRGKVEEALVTNFAMPG